MDLSINRATPVIDLTSADFNSIRSDLETYAQGKWPEHWTAFSASSFEVSFLELTAYAGDLLSYQMNATAQELYASTARRMQSLVNLGLMIGWSPREAEAASVVLRLTLDNDPTLYPLTIDQSLQFSNGAPGDSEVFFTPRSVTDVPSYPTGGTFDVEVVEGERATDILVGVSTGAPNQRYQLPQQGVLGASLVLAVGAVEWKETKNLVLVSSTGRFFRRLTNEVGDTFVAFGDGTFGAVPPLGTEIRATLRIAGGVRGNLSKNTIETVVNAPQAVLSCTNNARSVGGREAATLREAKGDLQAANSTLQRAVTMEDYSALATTIPGIAKVRATPGAPRGSRSVTLYVAPSGGGDLTPELAADVARFFKTRAMVNERTNVKTAFYRDCSMSLLIHVDKDYRANSVESVVRQQLFNANQTGLLDFASLDFAAKTVGDDGRPIDLLAMTRFQDAFAGLRSYGVNRVEVLELTAAPTALVTEHGNSGNGNISVVTLATNRKRRQYVVTFLASNRYSVRERLKGKVSRIATYALVDDGADFTSELENFSAGWRLIPNDGSETSVAVVSAAGQTVNVEARYSLYSLTAPDASYYLVSPSSSGVNIADTFTSDDGLFAFKVNVGSIPFAAGDILVVDVFPMTGDVVLSDEEYPVFTPASLSTRVSGGIRV